VQFQNPEIVGNGCFVSDQEVEIRTQEATFIFEVKSVDGSWFTGNIVQMIPFEDLSALDCFEEGVPVLGSFFSGYFWLEILNVKET
jgi:hypothetical protein